MRFLIAASLFFATFVHAQSQTPKPIGQIFATASLPGTSAFQVTGDAAKMMFTKLSGQAQENKSYFSKSVYTKYGNGIDCHHIVASKSFLCEFTVTDKGILVNPGLNR